MQEAGDEHKQKRIRIIDERHGGGEGTHGSSSSGPSHEGNREKINRLDRWLLKSGSRPAISQVAKLDRSGPSAGRTDGDSRPQLQNKDTQERKEVTSSSEGEKETRACTRNEGGVDMDEKKAEMTTTSEKQDTGNGPG